MDISTQLRSAMMQKGLSQKELAERTGLSKASISQYLSGYQMPRQDAIEALSKALGVALGSCGAMTVEQVAKRMGISKQFVRIGLQRGILPFGHAVKMTGSRYRYYINPKRFEDYMGGAKTWTN